ncbi:tachylectin-related carbohydrate-binding protein [Amycolatopsis sp. WGS_07]|uniref:tachylectin-related carbohydrate-binding protein n=1 Tax=Amycolatopsis sp. WGS_07 TaxID=3076764 RepID=UPI0038739990
MTTAVCTAAPASAVSGGTAVPLGSHPYLARISTATKACSGVLIDPSWILTSATCLTPDDLGKPTEPATVLVGDVDLGTGAGKSAKVAKVVRRADRDVVLAKLDAPATGVAVATVGSTAPQAGETLQLAGFGRTATEWVPARPRIAPFAVVSSTGTTIAAKSADGVDTCLGDAGGPALRTVGQSVEVVALHSASWQHGCLAVTETRQGSTETRVDDLGGWIRQSIVPTPVSCPGGAIVWSARADGTLWRYTHHDPAGGKPDWTVPPKDIGQGWNGRTIAGKGGAVWDIHRNHGAGDPFGTGVLKRWVYSPTTGWSGNLEVGSGWERYLTPEYGNRVTADEQGRIFMIDDQARLKVYVWNDATNDWVNGGGDVVDTGWGAFDSITAAGDGVLYARKPNGDLFRFKYDFAAAKWTQRNKPVGVGWNMFSEIFSPGGDILYGRGGYGKSPWDDTIGPVLRWYRYSDNTDTWGPAAPDGGGLSVGTGWNTEIHVTAAPDSCKLAG